MINIEKILFKNIYYTVEDKIILNNVNFSLLKNKINILIGSNGAGKTSLLEVLAGIRKTELDIDRNEILYLNLDYLIFDKLSVKEFLNMIIQINKTEHPEKILNDCSELNLNALYDVQVQYLSLGQSQKLLIQVALLSNRNIILLDEPFNGLDYDSKIILNRLLNKYKNKKTFFLATHDIESIGNVTDHIVKLDKGMIKN